jgi:hypothetical protein
MPFTAGREAVRPRKVIVHPAPVRSQVPLSAPGLVGLVGLIGAPALVPTEVSSATRSAMPAVV